MKKPNKIGSYIGECDYKEGHTELIGKHRELLESISKLLNYSFDNYNNLPCNYAPEGLISILRDQVKAKLDYGTINEHESKEAKKMIDLLEKKLL